MAEISRILIALGSVAAWTGLIILGMGMSELLPGASLINIGGPMMAVGLVVLLLGVVLYRMSREPDTSTH
ncbi:MAG: hypothetical protein ACKOCK_04655 [Chloroflexota bacterium]